MLIKASVIVRHDVTCEACGNEFHFFRMISETGYNSARNVKRRLMDQDYNNAKRCPKCHYLQSWMQENWEATRGAAVGMLIVAPIIGAVAWWYRWPKDGGWWRYLVYILAAVVAVIAGKLITDKLVVANFIWRKRHEGTVPSPRAPRITLVGHGDSSERETEDVGPHPRSAVQVGCTIFLILVILLCFAAWYYAFQGR